MSNIWLASFRRDANADAAPTTLIQLDTEDGKFFHAPIFVFDQRCHRRRRRIHTQLVNR